MIVVYNWGESMSLELEKLLSKKWVYDISRNVQFWHDELTIRSGKEGFRRLKLPNFHYARINRAGHADFFHLGKGPANKRIFIKALWKNLSKKSYVDFLERYYLEKGERLVKMSQSLKLEPVELEKYFREYGLMAATLDTTATASKLLTDYLIKELAGHPEATEIIAYYGRMKKKNPMQRLEADLARGIKNKINKNKLARSLHQKYCWIPVSFIGRPWGLKYFKQKVIDYQTLKRYVLKKPAAKVPKKLMYYLELLGEIAYLNEYRKSVFSRSNYIIRPLLGKIAKKFRLGTWEDLNLLATCEILDLFQGKNDYQKKLIISRRGDWLMYSVGQTGIRYLHGPEVEVFKNRFKPRIAGQKQVSGTIANTGKTTGLVKVVYEPKDFVKFRQGDILVAKMTSVDFIPIMKKAAAFVTDEGGLACHAAIASRELGVPCVIGTKNATDVFQDCDTVEVDADKGIIKKLKS